MSNVVKIADKISSIELVSSSEVEKVKEDLEEVMHEKVKRPEKLYGVTYKINSPLYTNALYVTLNYHVLNEGTPKEKRYPFEVFINSKSMDNFQWIVALTRMISGIFRKGGDVRFVVNELCSVADPNGQYYLKGKFYKSVVDHLGSVINTFFEKDLGWESNSFEENIKELPKSSKLAGTKSSDSVVLKGEACSECGAKAVVREDGCKKCLSCGHSNCG